MPSVGASKMHVLGLRGSGWAATIGSRLGHPATAVGEKIPRRSTGRHDTHDTCDSNDSGFAMDYTCNRFADCASFSICWHTVSRCFHPNDLLSCDTLHPSRLQMQPRASSCPRRVPSAAISKRQDQMFRVCQAQSQYVRRIDYRFPQSSLSAQWLNSFHPADWPTLMLCTATFEVAVGPIASQVHSGESGSGSPKQVSSVDERVQFTLFAIILPLMN